MLDNSINQRYQVPMQAMRPEQIREAVNASQQQAAMQGVDPQKVKQRIDENYTVNRLAQMEQNDMLKQYALAVPIWYGLSQSMDYFAKACKGEYKDTIQYRMGSFGDELVNTVNNTKLGQSSFAKGVNSGFTKFGKWFRNNVIEKSAILRSFDKTPTVPYHAMVRGQADGMVGALMFDYPQVAENFMKPLQKAENLDCYGASKGFIRNVKQELAKATSPKMRAEILELAEFELLSPAKSASDISAFKALDQAKRIEALKDIKARAFGYNDAKHMDAILKDIHNHTDDVINACRKANKNVFSKIWIDDSSWWGKFKGHLFGRKVYASEFANKLTGSLGSKNTNHKTWLGKMLPKVSNIFLEGSTNRVAGGKLIAIMQAYFLAECLIKTAQAEGASEKVRTFTERFTELVGFFIATPIAINLMHRFGGIQYAGMTEEFAQKALNGLKRKNFKSDAEFNAAKKLITDFQSACKAGKKPHEAYRQVLKSFNESALGATINQAEHAGGKKALRHLLKGETKNPFTRLVKKAARVVTVGLEQIAPLHKKGIDLKQGGIKKVGAVMKDFFKHPKYWFKQGAGYPVRFLLIMMSVMPFINGLGVKACHAIFGKPKKSVLDKEEETQTPQNLPPQMQNAVSNINRPPLPVTPVGKPGESNLLNQYRNPQSQQAQQIYAAQQQAMQQTQQVPSQSNLINQYKNNPQPIQHPQPQGPARTYIPSPEGVKIVNNSTEPARAYVPSPYGVKVNAQEDPSAANQALQRAEAAEKKAMEILKMH